MSELGKFHLKNNVPSSSKFVLPNLNKNYSNPTIISESKPESLSEFANLQLKNYLSSDPRVQHNKPMFSIPKLFASNKRKDDGVNQECERIVIDLNVALVPEEDRKSLSKKFVNREMEIEHFIPQFIDCENTIEVSSPKNLSFDLCCERILLCELKQKFSDVPSTKFSIIGRIIKKKYHKKVPLILHSFPKHTITRFAFDTPSPDDLILAHLNRNK